MTAPLMVYTLMGKRGDEPPHFCTATFFFFQNKLKGELHWKKLSPIFCLNRIDHQKWWIFAKESRSKFPIISWVITILIFLLFFIVILLFHSHFWIINEGIAYFKNEYNFWIPRAKNVRNVKFYRSNSIISKIMRPSFWQFPVLKGALCKTSTGVTSYLSKVENSNLNNSRNNENFDLLFFANIHHFWWSIRFKQKLENFFPMTLPL